MRVLLAIHGYPPIQNTGAERAAERIADWLHAREHEVEVFTTTRLDEPNPSLTRTVHNGVPVHRLSYQLKAGENPLRNTYENEAVQRAFQSVLKSGSFDIVHLISGYLFAGDVIHTAHAHGLPVVLTLTEYFFMCPRLNLMQQDNRLCSGPDTDWKCAWCLKEEQRRYRLARILTPVITRWASQVIGRLPFSTKSTRDITARRKFLRHTLEAADVVICPSRFIIHKFHEYGYNTQDFLFIQHGLDRPPHMVQQPTESASPALRVGYMGQINRHKGVDLLTRAAGRLLEKDKPLQLHIWGRTTDNPAYFDQLQKETSRHPQIQWRGEFEGRRVWEILQGIDVLVVPSRWYENCPTVILEAFKMGVPVIATRIGGMAELVAHETNGLLFRLNDADDLARQLDRLVNEPELLPKLKQGIPRVKSAGEEVEEIYQQYCALLSRYRTHQ